MFDIEILGYYFHFKHNNKVYPIVKIEARHEDDFLCMPIEFERVYDAYDWVDSFNDKVLDDMIKNFVDELWKEFHKGIPKVYGIRIDITLPIRPNMWIKQHIDSEFMRCLAIKHDEDRTKAKEKIKEYEMKKIEKVIFNDPATIVFWRDGSKTVVKAQNEPFDKEKGLAMAIAKKVYGNEGNYYNEIKKFIKDEPKEDNKNE